MDIVVVRTKNKQKIKWSFFFRMLGPWFNPFITIWDTGVPWILLRLASLKMDKLTFKTFQKKNTNV
jgi:hypothetical protein